MKHIQPYLNLLADSAFFMNSGRNINILEIGVARANSTKRILDALDKRTQTGRRGTGHLYSIDIDSLCARRVPEQLRKYWTFICGDSKEIPWDKEIDILFIDGDHSYEMAKSDFERFEKFLKPGGLIFMHDVLVERYGVKDFWEEITYPKVILPFTSGLGVVRKI